MMFSKYSQSATSPTDSNSRAREVIRKISGSFWFNLLAALVAVSLVQTFVVKLYLIPSGSMENTLNVGDRVLVNRLAYVGADPSNGDIVVFNASETWEQSTPDSENPLKNAAKWLGGLIGVGPGLHHTLVKRVIASPGQTISCCTKTGKMIVDGKPIFEPYVENNFDFDPGILDCSTNPISRRCVKEFIVPAGQFIVLGDNRAASADSLYKCRGAPQLGTCVRTVQRSDIVGKVFLTLWPLENAGQPGS